MRNLHTVFHSDFTSSHYNFHCMVQYTLFGWILLWSCQSWTFIFWDCFVYYFSYTMLLVISLLRLSVSSWFSVGWSCFQKLIHFFSLFSLFTHNCLWCCLWLFKFYDITYNFSSFIFNFGHVLSVFSLWNWFWNYVYLFKNLSLGFINLFYKDFGFSLIISSLICIIFSPPPIPVDSRLDCSFKIPLVS